MELVVGVLLFKDYETLDAHGPIELLINPAVKGKFTLKTIAPEAGKVSSAQGIEVIADYGITEAPPLDVLLVPGGRGTRALIADQHFLARLKKLCTDPDRPLKRLLSVCTGSALLAAAGLLDHKKATSNKLSWDWVTTNGSSTYWIKKARWVHDGNVITSAGVSAGMDMTLYFISQCCGEQTAEAVAKYAEYNGQWRDPNKDPWG